MLRPSGEMEHGGARGRAGGQRQPCGAHRDQDQEKKSEPFLRRPIQPGPLRQPEDAYRGGQDQRAGLLESERDGEEDQAHVCAPIPFNLFPGKEIHSREKEKQLQGQTPARDIEDDVYHVVEENEVGRRGKKSDRRREQPPDHEIEKQQGEKKDAGGKPLVPARP